MERSDSSNSAAKTRQSEIRQILAILHKWGIHTIGQLAALNKQQLGERLGPEAIRMWERANGQSSRVIKLIRPSESFQESFEFENEIETAEPLLFMLRRFLEQLAIRLSAIYLVAKELTLRITFTDKQIYERIFKIPQPTNNVDLLFRMLHTHLENCKSEYPIVAVALSAQPIKPAREQFGLFETTLRNPHQLSETLARLTALLGADRVGYSDFGRNASAGRVSDRAVHLDTSFRARQWRAELCHAAFAASGSQQLASPYVALSATKISAACSYIDVCFRAATSSKRDNSRSGSRSTRPVFVFRKLVG